jgi:hypothetical protein
MYCTVLHCTVALYRLYSPAEGRYKVYRAVLVISLLRCTTIATMKTRQLPGEGEEDI